MAQYNLKTLHIFWTLASLIVLAGLAWGQVAVVNAAHYWQPDHPSGNGGLISPDGLASAFGSFKIAAGQTSYSATPGQALPKILGGVKLTINGTDAELLYVSAGQINFVVPTNAPTGGSQTVTVTNTDSTTTSGQVRIDKFMPGIFSATSLGTGVAAANWTPDGVQPYPSVYSIVSGQPVHNNIDAGTAAKPSYLILYLTGIRNAPDTIANDPAPGVKNVAESVRATIGGVPAKVDFAGKQGFYAGLDQVNIVIPPELASTGILNVVVTVTDNTVSRNSNAVEIKLLKTDAQGKPILAPFHILKELNINGETVLGELKGGDDIDQNVNPNSAYYRNLYYADVYNFKTTAPNTSVTIDLRGDLSAVTPLDTLIILRKINSDGSLSFIAADDQGGGLGNGTLKANNNSLLFAVLPTAGEYMIEVTSTDVRPLATGSYSLKLSSNNITPITYGQTVNGNITGTDTQTAAGDYLDVYSFTGTEGQSIQITLRSSAFDSYLILLDQNGDQLAVDEDSGGGLDSRITGLIPMNTNLPVTRTFYIIATPLQPNATGAYTLSLVKTAGLAVAGDVPNATENRATKRVPLAEQNSTRRTAVSEARFRQFIEKEQ